MNIWLYGRGRCTADDEIHNIGNSVSLNFYLLYHYFNDQTPFSSTISMGRFSSSDLRPASRIAVVAMVFFKVGSGRASSCSRVTFLSFKPLTASMNFSNEMYP